MVVHIASRHYLLGCKEAALELADNGVAITGNLSVFIPSNRAQEIPWVG